LQRSPQISEDEEEQRRSRASSARCTPPLPASSDLSTPPLPGLFGVYKALLGLFRALCVVYRALWGEFRALSFHRARSEVFRALFFKYLGVHELRKCPQVSFDTRIGLFLGM
jgi:hypothetical protein